MTAKIEDIEVGMFAKGNDSGIKVKILAKVDLLIFVSSSNLATPSHYFTIERFNETFTLEAPEKWHDITKEEFPQYWNKEMYVWNDDVNHLKHEVLTGMSMKRDNDQRYETDLSCYKHCSPIKPTEDE